MHGKLGLQALLIVVMAWVLPAAAQAWRPDKPIEIVVPTTPGGGIDRSAQRRESAVTAGGRWGGIVFHGQHHSLPQRQPRLLPCRRLNQLLQKPNSSIFSLP